MAWRYIGPVAALYLLACVADPGYQGRSSANWIAQLGDSSFERRVEAVNALGKVLMIESRAPQVAFTLVRTLGDSVDGVRVLAATALHEAAKGSSSLRRELARSAVSAIDSLLADTQHAVVRVEAVHLMGALRDEGTSFSIIRLTRTLGDSAVEVRLATIQALAMIGPAALPPGGPLAALSTAPEADIRAAVPSALVRLRAPSSAAAPAFLQGLRDPEENVRRSTASALGELARERRATFLLFRESSSVSTFNEFAGPGVLSALIDSAKDRSAVVRFASVYSLGLIGDSTARPVLTLALQDSSSAVRQEAAHALSGFHRRGGIDDPDSR